MRLLALLLAALASGSGQTCPDPATVQAATQAAQRQGLASGLLRCLSEADPARRDGLGFETLSAWMRAGHLEATTLQGLRTELLALLAAPPEPLGVRQPFVLLVLAEVARVDRLQAFMTPEQRDELLNQASQQLRGWRDYRGFEAGVGWRHGVAHAADLLLQLALNPALEPEAQSRILEALASQVLADGQHHYQFGEGQRLARATWAALRRSGWGAEAWQSWWEALLLPLRAAKSMDGPSLARLHNLREFAWPLYVTLQEQGDAGLRERYLPALRETLRRLP